MNNIKIKTEGLDELKDKLAKIAEQINLAAPTWAAASILIRTTQENLPQSVKHMKDGVRYSFNKQKAEGKVHIMGGGSVYNDYMLRWFEKGTALRTTKDGKNRGKMPAYWFFRNAVNSSQQEAMGAYKETFNEQLQRIWNNE